MIPIGLQTIIIVPVAALLGCNILLAVTATLISNPITMFPIYYSSVKIGEYVTGIPLSWEKIELILESPTWGNLLTIGGEGILVFFSGGFFQGITGAILCYFIILHLVKYYRSKKIISS